MYFENMEAISNFLFEGSEVMDWVYNSDGYVVGYSQIPTRDQINISLFRLFLCNKPASNLQGFDNEKVVVTRRCEGVTH
jgi:hypothetical protein